MKILYSQRDPQEWQQFMVLLQQAVAADKLEQFLPRFNCRRTQLFRLTCANCCRVIKR
ncbi:Trp operon repressor [Actinobacillus equuli]|nr:Trp operon repressor [Actinobacillus equuli]